MPYKQFVLSGFAGLNEDNAPDRLADNELTEAFNTARNGSSYGTRPGLGYEASGATAQEYHTAPEADEVRGLYEMGNRSAVHGSHFGDFVSIIDADIYRDSTSGALTQSGTTISEDSGGDRWTFTSHKETLYGAGGADGNSIITWDGNPAANVTAVTFTGLTNPKYIHQKWNWGFIAGLGNVAAPTATDNSMIVRYSALNDLTTWPTQNTIGGSSAIGGFDSYGDNFITGFADFDSDATEWLLVLTNRRIYAVLQLPDPDQPFFIHDTIANGCVHQLAFVNLGVDAGDAVYVSKNGIHSLRQSQEHGGREDAYLSWKIRETFNTINRNRMDRISGAYWKDEGLVLFAVPTGSNNWADKILCLDIKGIPRLTAQEARWSVWVPAIGDAYITTMTTARDATTGIEYVYVGLTDGKILRFNRDSYNDISTGYTVRWQTKHNDFGVPLENKGLGDIMVRGNVEGSDRRLNYQAIFDAGLRVGKQKTITMSGSTGPQWDEAPPADGDKALWNVDTWPPGEEVAWKKIWGAGHGATIAHEFQSTIPANPFFISQVAYQVRMNDEAISSQEEA